jgi:hypothetical protein
MIRAKITEGEYWDILNNCNSLICGMHRVDDTLDYVFDFEQHSMEYARLCYLRAPTIDLSENEGG